MLVVTENYILILSYCLFVLYLKKKLNFEKKFFYWTDIKTSQEVQNEAIEHHYLLQFFFH